MSKIEIKKTGMMKSHFERLSESSKDYPTCLCADYDVRGSEQVVENGRLINKSVIRKVHPQDNFSGFKVSDFALENIIAVGAFDSLKECVLSDTVLGVADDFEGNVDKALAAVDAAESNVVSNDGGEE